MRTTLLIVIVAVVIGFVCSNAVAQQHDHRDWNTVNVGRMVALARIDPSSCAREQGGIVDCSSQAAEQAVAKLTALMDIFECRAVGEQTSPTIDTYGPLTEHDRGLLMMAEMGDLYCSLSPRRQLFPVDPAEFASICSSISWKCDAIWISDGDESVWHINSVNDLQR